MAQRIIVLGISTFSEFLLRFLNEQDHVETIAVDHDEERVDAITEIVDRPIIGSIRSHELLKSLDVQSADHVIVSLGDIENSLVCVLYLKHLGARGIVVKALNEEHVQILRLLRVDDIVFPERSTAELTALRLMHPQTLDAMRLSSGHRVVEITAPEHLIGKEIRPAAIKETYGLDLIMAIDATAGINLNLTEAYQVSAGDKLVLVGTDAEVERFEKEVF